MSVISGRGLSVRTIALGSVTALAALAAVNQQNAINAQRKYPPQGDFLRVRGVRLHKIDTGGPGPAVDPRHVPRCMGTARNPRLDGLPRSPGSVVEVWGCMSLSCGERASCL